MTRMFWSGGREQGCAFEEHCDEKDVFQLGRERRPAFRELSLTRMVFSLVVQKIGMRIENRFWIRRFSLGG